MLMSNFSFSGLEVLLVLSSMVGSTFLYVALSRKLLYNLKSFNFNFNFFMTGIIMALLATITFFNWESQVKNYGDYVTEEPVDDTRETPITVWKEPKKDIIPPPPTPDIKKEINLPKAEFKIKIAKQELIDEKIDLATFEEEPVIPTDFDSMMVAAKTVEPIPQPIEEEDDIVLIPERMPRFPGCEDLNISIEEKEACSKEKLLGYIYDKTNYPELARQIGLEGQVVVQFVVEKDGNVSDVTLVRDIGAGCGDSAFKAVLSMNDMDLKWTPGRQRGKPVRVKYTLPVKFRLK